MSEEVLNIEKTVAQALTALKRRGINGWSVHPANNGVLILCPAAEDEVQTWVYCEDTRFSVHTGIRIKTDNWTGISEKIAEIHMDDHLCGRFRTLQPASVVEYVVTLPFWAMAEETVDEAIGEALFCMHKYQESFGFIQKGGDELEW